MNGPVIRDAIDKEHLEQVLRTRGWEIFSGGVLRIAADKLKDLRRDQTLEETARLRGFLDALDYVMGTPQMLIEEFNHRKQP